MFFSKERKTHENIAVTLIWDDIGRLLLIFKAKPGGGVWMLPGGHTEPKKGEDITAAADRENVEETTLSGISGYHFLFYLEDKKDNHPRVFFVHEGFYFKNIPEEDIRLPEKLLKKEGIKEARWFFLDELEGLVLSPIAKEAIEKTLSLAGGQKDVSTIRARNYLQKILAQAQKTIDDPDKLEQVNRAVKELDKLVDGFNKDNESPASRPAGENGKSKKDTIMLVDDDRILGYLLKEFLERSYFVLTFDNPADALNYLKKPREGTVKAVLADYHFPFSPDIETGADFIEIVNRLYPDIKTILFTGDDKAAESHPGPSLKKPIEREAIIRAIEGAEEEKET